MNSKIVQGIAGIYWFFDPRRVRVDRLALIFRITEDEVQSIKDSAEYLDAIENLMLTTRSPSEFVKWVNTEGISQLSEHLGERMDIDSSVVPDMIERVLRRSR